MDEKNIRIFSIDAKDKINMKERYKVLKKIYPYYLILIKKIINIIHFMKIN